MLDTLPGATVVRGDRGPLPLPADDVSTRFEAVISERGPVGVPVDCRSWTQVRTSGVDASVPGSTTPLGGFGDHTGFSTLRAVEQHFRFGGSRAVLSRAVGPDARAAVLALRDAEAATTITVEAVGPGSWYHAVRVTVTRGDGDDRIITVTLAGTVLASGTAADEQQAADIIDSAPHVRAVLGAGRWPIDTVADTALSGGDDDRANITQREVDAALDVFGPELGAGALCASGWTTADCHESLAERAAASNRQARGDMPDVADAGTLIAQADRIRALGVEAGRIKLLAGHTLVDVAGLEVPVAASGAITGREARGDREHGAGPGQPAAWTFGVLDGVRGVSQRWSSTDLAAMLAAGITPVVQDPRTGQVWALDSITAADPDLLPQYAQDAAMRVVMAVHQQVEQALAQRVMQVMDAHVVPATEADCVAVCAGWQGRGALVDFAVQVTADAAARRLTGQVELIPTGSVRSITFTIVADTPSAV